MRNFSFTLFSVIGVFFVTALLFFTISIFSGCGAAFSGANNSIDTGIAVGTVGGGGLDEGSVPSENSSLSDLADDASFSFFIDGKLYKTLPLGSPYPDVPERAGYSGEWKQDGSNRRADAVYTLVNYTLTFVLGDEQKTALYNVEISDFALPEFEIPEWYGVEWSGKFNYADATFTGALVKNNYEITFVSRSGEVTLLKNIENLTSDLPEIAPVEGYTARWPKNFTPDAGKVYAEYIPIEYTATFKIDGEVQEVITFTVEDLDFTPPALPERLHHTGKWEEYTAGAYDLEINAVYTEIEYTLAFIADGVKVAEFNYKVSDFSHVVVPEVPEKYCYTAEWSEFDLTAGGNIVVEAVYTPIAVDIENFTFRSDGKGGYVVTDYSGIRSFVIIPDEYKGKSVTAIDSYAFYNNADITTVVVPESVKTIDYCAFSCCGNIEKVLIFGKCTVNENAFYNCNSGVEIIYLTDVQ